MEISIILTCKRERSILFGSNAALELDAAWNLLIRYEKSVSLPKSVREAEHLWTATESVTQQEVISPCISYCKNTTMQKLYSRMPQDVIIPLPYMKGSLSLQGISSKRL